MSATLLIWTVEAVEAFFAPLRAISGGEIPHATFDAPALDDDEAEWEAAFASPEFHALVAAARGRIARGEVFPLRLDDL